MGEGGGGRGEGGGTTGSKFVPSIKNILREICISGRVKEISWWGQWKVVFFSNPKGDLC